MSGLALQQMPEIDVPIRDAPGAFLQPEVRLVRWRVMETELGERHFVGYHMNRDQGRVSSAIEYFDPAERRGVTRSGRVYELLGEPASDGDTVLIWAVWAAAYGVVSSLDVTEQALSDDGA